MRGDRKALLLFLVAIVLYAPGLWWGADPDGSGQVWGSDELAPHGPLEELRNVFLLRQAPFNPKYPLFGYLTQFIALLPYAAWVKVTGGVVGHPSTLFGLTLAERSASLLMAAGVVVLAAKTAEVLWNRRTGWMAGAITLLLYPMLYYSRTSNVDMPALFWTALGLWAFARILRDGLTLPFGMVLGTAAALAIATKDASYGAFLPLGLLVAVRHRAEPRLLVGVLSLSVVVYAVASGLLFHTGRFREHIEFLIHGSSRHHGFHYGSARPCLDVLAATGNYLIEAISLPVALAAATGLLICWREDRRTLLAALPAAGIVLLTILPARFVLDRFVLIAAYVLALFAGRALAAAPAGRVLATVLCGWSLLRGGDLTRQMLQDSRYAAGQWLRHHAKPGDRIGYYGSEPHKLPFLPSGITAVPAQPGVEFLIVIPWQDYERTHEYDLPDLEYQALRSGSRGYRLVFDRQTPALFPAQPGSWVNPRVQIFARL
jgi:hypothetical protein